MEERTEEIGNMALEAMDEYSILMSSLKVSVSKHLLDEHFTLVWANSYYYELIDWPKKEYEATFHNRPDLFFADHQEAWNTIGQAVQDAIANRQTRYECVTRMKNKDGNLMWIKLSGTFTDEIVDGFPIAYTTITDISDLMQVRIEQMVTFNNIPGFVAKFKVRGLGYELLEANDKFLDFFGDIDMNDFDLLGSDLGDAGWNEGLRDNYERIKNGQSVHFVIHVKDQSGAPAWLQLNGECIDWINNCPVYLVIYIDVTDITTQQKLLEESNDRLERLAFVDPETGGYNRTKFELEADNLVKDHPADTYAFIALDIQKFKVINDLFGVATGDRVLKYIYDILMKHLREGEVVGRIVADNFNLILYNDSPEAIEKRLNDIMDEVNSFNTQVERKYVIYAAAGVYPISEPELPMTSIRDRANVARKNIKNSSDLGLCSCTFYSDEERQQIMLEKDLENHMKDALKNEEFIVYLQPKLSLKDNTVSGAEALVRWLDPRKGRLVPPNVFIPFFEKNRFIVLMDLYVFERVCAMLRKWIDRGVRPVPVSVNMSRAHLEGADYLEPYERIRRKYDIPAEYLEIELTETLIFEDPKKLLDVINRIHALGFKCSMDDFGSGYSSLNVLKDMDVDVLKLDRVFFLSEQEDNTREKEVIKSVLDLAKCLDMRTVAEGVETQSQLEFLRQSDCDYVQGYVFSKPIPEQDFEKLVYGKEL